MKDGFIDLNDEDMASPAEQHDETLPAPRDPVLVALAEFLSTPDAKEAHANLPRPFQLRADGLHTEVTTIKAGIEDVRVCGPILVVAMARTTGSSNWCKLVRFVDHDGNVREELFAASDLARRSARIVAKLASLGFEIDSHPDASKHLGVFLSKSSPEERITLTDRLGWVDDRRVAFVLGSGRVIGDGNYRPTFDLPTEHADSSKSRGTLVDWRASVAARCVGNPLMIVSVSLALAGPLFDLLKLENCGLHLRGSSSSGKSTLQRLACSVWGSRDLMLSWNGTRAGIEAVAARTSGTILVLDELAEVDASIVGDVIYMLGNGRGRQRSTARGGAQPSAHWRMPILSSGEISVAEHMLTSSKKMRAGIEMRLLDIPADGQTHRAFDTLHGHKDGAEFARAIDSAVGASHGTAGAALVEFFVRRNRDYAELFTRFEAGFKKEAKSLFDYADDPLTERALSKFAMIAFAGGVATAAGITGWPTGTARNAALTVVKLWLDGRNASTKTEIEALLAPLRSFIAAHGKSDFIDLSGPNAATSIVKSGWVDKDYFYFTPSAFELACGTDDKDEVLDLLERMGHLGVNNGRGKQWKMSRSVPSRPTTYAVKRAVFNETE